jgi:hypothetical protein
VIDKSLSLKLFKLFENKGGGGRKWQAMRVGWTNKGDGKELQEEERCTNTKKKDQRYQRDEFI